jgi:hypothetical protein
MIPRARRSLSGPSPSQEWWAESLAAAGIGAAYLKHEFGSVAHDADLGPAVALLEVRHSFDFDEQRRATQIR